MMYVDDKLTRNVSESFTTARHYNEQMIIMCHKPAHLDNLSIFDTNISTSKLILSKHSSKTSMKLK